MRILRKVDDQNIIIHGDQRFSNEVGWEDSFSNYETEILKDIINQAENYDTVRYIHKPYYSIYNINQTDIWYHFSFIDSEDWYDFGTDYSLIGLSNTSNMSMDEQSTNSFFRLEFYKTPNGDLPDRTNRRLAFTKNLSVPLSERQYYPDTNLNLSVPIFVGSNLKNKENMYLFWFMDDNVLEGTTLTGNTFYITAKFYNSVDGTIIDFTNKPLNASTEVNETFDMYYKVTIDRSDYSFVVHSFDNYDDRIGVTNNPIRFYQKRN